MTITPGSFDHDTAREMVGDAHARVIEAKARNDADSANFDPPKLEGATYFAQVQAQMRIVVYTTQYHKRAARNERKKGAKT